MSIAKCEDGSILKCSNGKIKLVGNICPLLNLFYTPGDWPEDGVDIYLYPNASQWYGTPITDFFLKHLNSITRAFNWSEINSARTILYSSGGEATLTLSPTSGALSYPSGTQPLTFGISVGKKLTTADVGTTAVEVEFSDANACCPSVSLIINVVVLAIPASKTIYQEFDNSGTLRNVGSTGTGVNSWFVDHPTTYYRFVYYSPYPSSGHGSTLVKYNDGRWYVRFNRSYSGYTQSVSQLATPSLDGNGGFQIGATITLPGISINSVWYPEVTRYTEFYTAGWGS